jgi:rhodanese-related sulfurtransferase
VSRMFAGGMKLGFLSHLFASPLPSLDPSQAQARLRQNPAPFLLDVRQPEEYQAGHIEGARLIPLAELGRRTEELPRDAELICVCRSGNRSSQATQLLSSRGYNAFNLSGGVIAWIRAGLPVEKGSTR